jgi:RimJ/RimL family protein N-acetyltransferase
MQLFVKEMDDIFAEEILNWGYDAPYDFYNNEFSVDARRELLNNSYLAILDQQEELIGFFCIGESAQVPIGSNLGANPEGYIDVGIGMNPVFTGQGLGFLFFSYILNHIREVHGLCPIRLTVAAFNTRAIHLYEKLGFVKDKVFNHRDIVFITMIREAS